MKTLSDTPVINKNVFIIFNFQTLQGPKELTKLMGKTTILFLDNNLSRILFHVVLLNMANMKNLTMAPA